MSELEKKLAVANFNSGAHKIVADLCGPLTKESTQVHITVPGPDSRESFFYELQYIGLEPKDVVIWGAGDPHVPEVKSLPEIYSGNTYDPDEIDGIEVIALTKSGVQKMVSAGVRHPVLDVMAEHYKMQRPSSHKDKV